MARSNVHPGARRRILRVVRDRLLYDSKPAQSRRTHRENGPGPGAPGKSPVVEDRKAKKSRPVRRRRGRVKAKAPRLLPLAIAKLVLLGLFIITGAAVVIWLRNLGEAFGINWIGD